jgi:hypothetical protein
MDPKTELASDPQLAAALAPAEPLRRRQLLAWTLFGLIPASVLIAFLVLHFMAASAAAATGGCGGG